MITTEGALLETKGLVKRFGSNYALQGLDFAIYPGEIVALLGDNGAGKSTLVKMLAGLYKSDGGQILVEGTPVHLRQPSDARALGIETVYQDLALVETLDVTANIFLGREPVVRLFGLPLELMNRRHMRAETRLLLTGLGILAAPAGVPMHALSSGQRQVVAIARAIYWQARLLVMDEPTTALSMRERALVWRLLIRLREQGIAALVVSHNLEEILPVADRAVVLRQGRKVGERLTEDMRAEDIVQLMAGGDVTASLRDILPNV